MKFASLLKDKGLTPQQAFNMMDVKGTDHCTLADMKKFIVSMDTVFAQREVFTLFRALDQNK